MSSVVANPRKGLKTCLVCSGVLVTVTLVLSLYSGSSPARVNGNITSKLQDQTGVANYQDRIRGPARRLEADKSQPLTTDGIMDERFSQRRRLAYDTCKRPEYQTLRAASKRHKFSSIARKRVKWCRIPKVGTTYLSSLEHKFFNVRLSKSEEPYNAKTLVFVREPYSRLVSGYIGKIVTNQPWWKNYGTSIVRKFRPRATDKAMQCGNDVTFPEFLKYFIATQVDRFRPNPHWQPTHKLCNPCSDQYHFIAHLETFKDDLSHVLKTVNVSVDMDFSDEEQTMRGKARSIVSQREKIKKCESMCSALRKVWWSFQARGLISTDIRFPLSAEECDSIGGEAFGDLAWDAHIQSTGNIDKYKQKREAMVKLYLQVPLADRMKVRELLMKDFELYGYDSQPADLFPELSKHSQ